MLEAKKGIIYLTENLYSLGLLFCLSKAFPTISGVAPS